MQETSKIVTAGIINSRRPKTILDAPCGRGWLPEKLAYDACVDGIDLYEVPRGRYRDVLKHDLNLGLPSELPTYDCLVCCEGIEHIGNPFLFFKTAMGHLNPKGFMLITTPNIWYPAARLKFLMRGFFPGFPCLAGKILEGTHMHIMPWSFPKLYLYLRLNRFKNITLHLEPLSRPKHLLERFVALPQKIYCKGKIRKASDSEERRFWQTAVSGPSLYGRHLIVTAER